jgi:hypothetical protein
MIDVIAQPTDNPQAINFPGNRIFSCVHSYPGTTKSSEVRFRLLSLYPRYICDGEWEGPQSVCTLWTRQKCLPLLGIEFNWTFEEWRPWGLQEEEAPRFQDSRHIKVVRLSALGPGRLYPPGNISDTHCCYRLSRPQGLRVAGRIMSMKNSNDTIGNQTRDLPDCSAVPQRTAPSRE